MSSRQAQAAEPMLLETFIAQPAVKALDVAVLNRLARLDEREFDPVLRCPGVERPPPDFTAIVEGQAVGSAARRDDGVPQ